MKIAELRHLDEAKVSSCKCIEVLIKNCFRAREQNYVSDSIQRIITLH
jgi:hypothetical protein